MNGARPRETRAVEDENDLVLILAARGGDQDAFRQLYERYAPAVLGFLVHRLGDHALAEDALQEAFCKAYRALDTFDARRRFGPWISTIAENVSVDVYRRRSKLEASLREDLAAEGPDTLRLVAERESEEILRAALKVLPDPAREILLLRYRNGMTQSEVATQLGCSVRTVQTREATALELLISMLDARRKTDP
jgi:RNA polymerase sigma-70 factor (ECF subfamily)